MPVTTNDDLTEEEQINVIESQKNHFTKECVFLQKSTFNPIKNLFL